MAEDGFIYERRFIEEWFNKGGEKSPKTLLPMGTALFYPFEYYQLRSVWAKAKGLPDPPKPQKYGRISPPAQPYSSIIVIPFPVLRRTETHTVNYEDDDDYAFDEEEFPPLSSSAPRAR
jgi:hypothetical protein